MESLQIVVSVTKEIIRGLRSRIMEVRQERGGQILLCVESERKASLSRWHLRPDDKNRGRATVQTKALRKERA